jgi:hypothetical protein
MNKAREAEIQAAVLRSAEAIAKMLESGAAVASTQ